MLPSLLCAAEEGEHVAAAVTHMVESEIERRTLESRLRAARFPVGGTAPARPAPLAPFPGPFLARTN